MLAISWNTNFDYGEKGSVVGRKAGEAAGTRKRACGVKKKGKVEFAAGNGSATQVVGTVPEWTNTATPSTSNKNKSDTNEMSLSAKSGLVLSSYTKINSALKTSFLRKPSKELRYDCPLKAIRKSKAPSTKVQSSC